MTLRRLFLLWIMVSGCCIAHAQNQPKPETLSRDEVTQTIADVRKIVTPQGIDDTRILSVNGTRQWISVRGKDRRNPLLLVLHGGPGSPEMPDDWTFQTPWEDFFTVVEWDQRGAGKTYALNDPKTLAPTMTIPQMVQDTEVVIQYLLQTYNKRRLILLGHSWGSVLGVQVAQLHPEWLYAYVGVGQLINTRQNEVEGYNFALAQAKAHANIQAIQQLEQIAPYPGDVSKLPLQSIGVQRKWLTYYGGLAWGRQDFKWDSHAWELSPDYSEKQLDAVDAGSAFSISHLMQPLLAVNLEDATTFHCPVFLFVGRHDYATSHTLAESWFHKISAPQKQLIWFQDASHLIMQEQPGRFLQHMVESVRPIAAQAGDAAPDEVIER